jgi:hypothetical protein
VPLPRRATSAKPSLGALRLDAVLLFGPGEVDEQAAVRAFEPLMPVGVAAQERSLELLVAVRADDLVGGVGFAWLTHLHAG